MSNIDLETRAGVEMTHQEGDSPVVTGEDTTEEKDQAIQKLHRNLGAAQTCASESMHQLQVGIMPERASHGEWCMFLIILSCIHVSAEGQGLLSSRCLRQSSVKSAFFVSCKSPGSTT